MATTTGDHDRPNGGEPRHQQRERRIALFSTHSAALAPRSAITSVHSTQSRHALRPVATGCLLSTGWCQLPDSIPPERLGIVTEIRTTRQPASCRGHGQARSRYAAEVSSVPAASRGRRPMAPNNFGRPIALDLAADLSWACTSPSPHTRFDSLSRRRTDTPTNHGIPSPALWVTTRAWGRVS
jgi:hypothetical protein